MLFKFGWSTIEDIFCIRKLSLLLKISNGHWLEYFSRYVNDNKGIERCFFHLVTSVGQRKNSESPWGIEPQTFGFRAPMLYHWATETPRWAKVVMDSFKASRRNYDLMTSKSRKNLECSIPVLLVPKRYLFTEEVFMRSPKNLMILKIAAAEHFDIDLHCFFFFLLTCID